MSARRVTTSAGIATATATAGSGQPSADATPDRSSAVSTSTTRSTGASRDLRARTRLRSGGLEQKAAAEAGWVSEDLRRIAVISAIMLAGLALAWVLLVPVGVGGFY